MLVAVIDPAELFNMSMAFDRGDLHVSLADYASPEKIVSRWPPENEGSKIADRDPSLKFTRNFELGGHLWTVRVETGQNGAKPTPADE